MKMSKKYSSRATKMVLASLLAASVALPNLAAAEVETSSSSTTSSSQVAEMQKLINFTIEPADSRMASYFKKPGKLISTPYAKGEFLDPQIEASALSVITALTVNGQSVLNERNGVKTVYIPVTEDYSDIELSITTKYSSEPTVITLNLDPESVREEAVQKEVVEEEKQDPGLVITSSSLPDGVYTATASYLNEKDYTKVSSMGNYFSKDVVIKVQNGKATLDVSIIKDNKAILEAKNVIGDKTELAEVTAKTVEGYNKVFTLPVEKIGDFNLVNAVIDYSKSSAAASMPAGMPAINNHNIVLKVDATTLATKGTITAVHATSTEPSIMNSYMNSNMTVKALAEGYEVEMSFHSGQYVHGFEVEGKEATLVKAHSNTDKTSIYKFNVSSLKELINSKIHVIVPGMYDINHDVRLKFEGKAIQPFGDIEKSWAKNYINELYTNGIFATAKNFNPTNKTERYQFALMLQRALKLDVPNNTTFKDIQKFDAETVDAVKALSNFGVINGKDAAKTTFDPKGQISRQDTAIMINRLLAKYGYVAKEDATVTFADVKDATKGTAYEKEAYNAIAQLNSLGIMTGKDNNKFDPKGTLTRQEMAKVLTVTLEVLQGLKK
jgi:heme-binding NEAT domain protein